MPMRYRDLLEIVRGMGFDEVLKQNNEGFDMRIIAKPPIVVPFAFPHRGLILDNGNDTEVDDEIIEALFRWIDDQLGRARKPH
jgi:hypothetical protein